MVPPKVNKQSIGRIALGCAAVALAAGPLRKSAWRYPLYAAAGYQLASATAAQLPRSQLRDLPEAPERLHGAEVNGIWMHWEDHGPQDAALPIVMVHGLPTNPRLWRYAIPPLTERGLRCLAWEQVGFGGSMRAGLGRDLSIPSQARYLYDWLQFMGIEQAIFVGHDYGGGVVQQLLVDHPQVVKGVVLADVVAYRNWPVPAVRAAQALAPVLGLLPSLLLKPVLYMAVRNLHATRAYDGESFETIWRPYHRALGPRALAHQLKFFRNEDTLRVGHALERLDLNIPAQVIWGERDPLGLPSARRLAAALKAPLTVIAKERHFSVEDHPEIIAQAVQTVLEQARGDREDSYATLPGSADSASLTPTALD